MYDFTTITCLLKKHVLIFLSGRWNLIVIIIEELIELSISKESCQLTANLIQLTKAWLENVQKHLV